MNPVGSEDRLARARALYDANRYDLAVTSALDAIAIDPNDAGGHVILALSYERLGRLREAEAAARRAIELDPARSRTYIAFGLVRLAQRRYPEALDAFREAAGLDANDDDAYRLAAIAQMNQNHYHDALTMIERALAIEPEVIANREVRAMILRALGRRSEAEAETARVLRMHPESVLGLSEVGYLGLLQGDPVRAKAAFREALRLDPNSASIRAGYERVVTTSTPYADWCGPKLTLLGVFFFFSAGPIAGFSGDLAVASLCTAFVIWLANRPIAVEALRDDEIGRTFLAPFVLARNHVVLLYAALAECSLFVIVPTHRDSVIALTVGALAAASATARAMRAGLDPKIRTIYARLAHVLAICGAAVAAAAVTRSFLDPGHRSQALENVVDAALLAAVSAGCLLLVLDTIFVLPAAVARLFTRARRR